MKNDKLVRVQCPACKKHVADVIPGSTIWTPCCRVWIDAEPQQHQSKSKMKAA